MTYYKLENLRLTADFLALDSLQVDRSLDEFIAASLSGGRVESYRIINKSIDSRRRNAELVYNLIISSAAPDLRPTGVVKLTAISEDEALSCLAVDFQRTVTDLVREKRTLPVQPIVVGSGPAGIFCAYFLALAGCKPIILDCGFEVEKRSEDIQNFYRTRELNECSNFLMGEGGAGTFSDGKLYTRINSDWYGRVVINEFIKMGAPEEIRYLKRPHIGSDNLFNVCQKFRAEIIRLGGVFKFGFEVAELWCRNGRCVGVSGSNGEKIAGEYVVIASGVGGHKLHKALIRAGVAHQVKGFQLGCRIEHPQKMVDNQQYHTMKRPAALGAAEYNFISKAPDGIPGVSTFCMCPGGEVVMSSAEIGHASTNGMSKYRRDGEFANSCLIVTYGAEDFPRTDEAWNFLSEMERRIFVAGGGDYTLPAQGAKHFLSGVGGLCRKRSSCQVGIVPGRLDELLPEKLATGIRYALKKFDTMAPGFISEGNLIGVETFVSSPCRFLRDEKLASSLPGLYVAGEGAGYAGGIVSGAVDGLKIAEQILKLS